MALRAGRVSKERRWDLLDVTLGVLGLAYVGWVVAVGLFGRH